MTTIVTVTGTGYPRPSATRAGPGVLVQHGDLALQFDAGRSTVQRLAAIGVTSSDLDAVFVTHHHSDHTIGLADLVLTRWTAPGRRGNVQLPVVCPDGPVVGFLERLLDPWEFDIAVRQEHTGRTNAPAVEILPFPAARTPSPVWERGSTIVSACLVQHDPVRPAVGYRIETPDGAVAISGDTSVCDEVIELARGADVLVHEAMLFEDIGGVTPGNAIMDYHADSRLLGALAKEAGVETLVLTHLIPEPDEAGRQRYAENAQRGFDGEVIVADDLTSVVIGA